MKIKTFEFAWMAYFILSVLMELSIGRSYMWIFASFFVLGLLLGTHNIFHYKNQLVNKYIIFIVYCSAITICYYFMNNLKENTYIKSQLIEILLLGFIAAFMCAYSVSLEFIVKFIKKLSWILLVAGVIEEVTKFNITKYFGNQNYIDNYLIKEGRISSIFGHPIAYAIFLMFVFLLAIYFPYKTKNKQTMYILMILLNLFCTKTRMVLVAIIIVCLIFCLKTRKIEDTMHKKYSLNNFLFVTMIILGVIIICIAFRSQIFEFVSSFSQRIISMFAVSGQGIRLGAITNCFLELKKNTFLQILFGKGTGYASQFMIDNPILYWNNNGEEMLWNETTDNMYITILMNYGIIGAVLFITILIYAIKIVVKTRNRILVLAASGIISLYITFFFFEGLFWPLVINIFAIYFAIISKYEEQEIKEV